MVEIKYKKYRICEDCGTKYGSDIKDNLRCPICINKLRQTTNSKNGKKIRR